MKFFLLISFILLNKTHRPAWGFFGHQKINYYAVFLLPPEMIVFYKQHADFLREHAVDPDKRRYIMAAEGPRHYIDMDHYGPYPFDSLPRRWEDAVNKYSEDTLSRHGIVPWWISIMKRRLTSAFKNKNAALILKLSADLGHYIADAHVPLHTSSNHNGQLTGQQGIHGFWESRIPELLADKEWNLYAGRAQYIKDPPAFIWNVVLQSAAASDSVLSLEKKLTQHFRSDQKFSFEERKGKIIRQYSSSFCRAYNEMLNGMIERRMIASIAAVSSFWYTAWIDAGQPDLLSMVPVQFSNTDSLEFEKLQKAWMKGEILGREEE